MEIIREIEAEQFSSYNDLRDSMVSFLASHNKSFVLTSKEKGHIRIDVQDTKTRFEINPFLENKTDKPIEGYMFCVENKELDGFWLLLIVNEDELITAFLDEKLAKPEKF